MIPNDPSTTLAMAMGVGLGVLGFLPLMLPFALARHMNVELSVGRGMAAVAVSFLFLLAALGAVWACAPNSLLAVTVGLIVGFFAMWAVLAYKAVRHKL